MMRERGVAIDSEAFIEEIKRRHRQQARFRWQPEDLSFRHTRDWQSVSEVEEADKKVTGKRWALHRQVFEPANRIGGERDDQEIARGCERRAMASKAIFIIQGLTLQLRKPWPFDSSKTPPDKHMVVFYNDVIDSSFNVQDFDVTLTANILPSSITVDMLNEVWSKISGPSSGSFDRTDTFEVKYQNPKQGGVYRFDFDLGISGCAKSEANVVLPLSGAEVSSIVGADLARADAFAAIANSKYPTKAEKILRMPFWFWIGGNGDYLGRPNNSSSRTCVHYNKMNPSTGMGAACTWFGTSVLVAKLSNFMYAYAARKLGFTLEEIEDGGAFGTDDDDATLRCYYLGWVIANGATYSSQIPPNMPYIWENSDSEEHKIVWSNAGTHNYDWFLSPGFLDLSAADI